MKRAELYRFTMDDTIWTFTSADASQVHESEVYSPVAIGRSEIESKNELSKANIEVKLDIDNEFSQMLLRTYNELVLGLTIFVEENGEIDVAWKGRISSIKPVGSELCLVMESVFTSLRRTGLRARYQKTCRHALYAVGCNVDSELYAVESTISSQIGSVIVVPAASDEADGFYLGGMARIEDGSLRLITSHVGNSLVISRAFASFEVGMNVKIYPGCDRIRQTCKDRFANDDNFGGFPWIPAKNPFGGSSIA